ncbi:SDR family NAD(P)-dependent oxidoreductase [Gulosibacter chungangensis]|uniref:SDR family NAD(P)-dependent oxidoreductase n=1 Tax=Gulosibacter chungangensis TaxID=979746 RepID=UPI001788663B|nr:SDR family NAD(P)-dependent oxidoreductase [Gulosibacter chungangensis]
MSIAGKVGIITGAGSGLGRDIALLLAADGARVIVADRDIDGAEETVRQIHDAAGDAVAVELDVTDVESVAEAFEEVDTQGKLYWAVNCAGIHPDDSDIADLDLAAFDRIMSVNTRGVVLSLREEMRRMREHGSGGAIVNIGSTRSIRAMPGSVAYVASKHAVIGVTETAALEGGPIGVRVNCVCPGVMNTPMVAARRAESDESEASYVDRVGGIIPRIAEAKEVAEGVRWLLSDASSYVTGHTLMADGGYKIRP